MIHIIHTKKCKQITLFVRKQKQSTNY